jgi:dUTP pyrophosphatase
MKVYLDSWGIMPVRAHSTDAGMDFRTSKGFTLKAGDSYIFESGVHVSIPVGYMGKIETKSGLNVNYGIQATGVVDAGFSGQIIFKLYNLSDTAYTFKKGDKVAQMVLTPILTPDLELVNQEELSTDCAQASTRGASGFGSTGK